MDVARYKIHYQSNSSGAHLQGLHQWKQRNSALDAENDVDGLDPKLREGGRYFSTRYSNLERHKDFKRVLVVASVKSLVDPEEFIPLSESPISPEQCNNESVAKLEIEESWDDEVLRKTKEFNKMSREFPHDEKVWIAFAEFQVRCLPCHFDSGSATLALNTGSYFSEGWFIINFFFSFLSSGQDCS